MANYFVEYDILLGGDPSGGTVTQNVAFGDTITVDFRGDGPEDFAQGSTAPVNCSVSEIGSSPVLSGGTRFIVSGFVGGTSYSVQFVDDEGDYFDLVGSVSGGAGGSDTYGIEVFGPNGTSVVFSPSHRFSNTNGAVTSLFRLSPSPILSRTYTVPGASGASSYSVLITFFDTVPPTITKNATSYTLTVTSSDFPPGEPSITATSIAVLIG